MRLPRGYREPETVYTVEWVDDEGRGLGQAGAFYSLQAAEACRSELAAGAGNGELIIGTIAVHERVQDWEWDR